MKMRWYDRALIVCSGLFLTAAGILALMIGLRFPIGPYAYLSSIAQAIGGIGFAREIQSFQWYMMVLFWAIGILLLFWGLRVIVCLFQKPPRPSYYHAQGVENGSLDIAINALTQLVGKCLDRYPQLSENKVRVQGETDAVRIELRTTLQSDIPMPQVTEAVRREIRAYLLECAGVHVEEVNIVVEATKPGVLVPRLEAPAQPPPAAPAAPIEVISVPAEEPVAEVAAIPAEDAPVAEEENHEILTDKPHELDIDAELAKANGGRRKDE